MNEGMTQGVYISNMYYDRLNIAKRIPLAPKGEVAFYYDESKRENGFDRTHTQIANECLAYGGESGNCRSNKTTIIKADGKSTSFLSYPSFSPSVRQSFASGVDIVGLGNEKMGLQLYLFP
jgi:hypothetical protein